MNSKGIKVVISLLTMLLVMSIGITSVWADDNDEEEEMSAMKVVVEEKQEESLQIEVTKVIVNPTAPFNVDVWVDKGDGAVYQPGEKLYVYFKSDRDCYLTLFDFTTTNDVHVIFPNRYNSNNYIQAGRVYKIPGPDYGFEFEVEGPPGTEIIKAIATLDRRRLTGQDLSSYSGYEESGFATVSEDPGEFVTALKVVVKPLPQSKWAEDSAVFYVGRRPSYAGVIRIDSDPSGAEVYVDGHYIGTTSMDYAVLAGTYTVEVMKSGYDTWQDTVNVSPDRMVRVSAYLSPSVLYGFLEVDSNPSGASVYLDGEYLGITPLPRTDIEADVPHDLRVELAGYEGWSKAVQVAPNRGLGITASLESLMQYGYVRVNSDPAGATVYLDGEYLGATPIPKTEIEANVKHTLKIELSNYLTWTQTFSVGVDRTLTLTATLVPIVRYGYIRITSDPPGASVYLDGEYIGETPLFRIKVEANVPHTVRVELADHVIWDQTFTVSPDESLNLSASLVPVIRYGYLDVESEPSSASIYLDGEYLGRTPLFRTKVEANIPHIARIELTDYVIWEQTFTVSPDRTMTLTATLTPVIRYGYLNIESDPSGAKVYLDGDYLGFTPIFRTRVEANVPHVIRIELTDYKAWEKMVEISPDQTTTVTSILTPLIRYGFLKVDSIPQGASVYLDDKFLGVTPLTETSVIAKDGRRLRVEALDYDVWTRFIDIEPDRTTYRNVILTPLYASLSISSVPRGAEVFLDGEKRGETSATPLIITDVRVGIRHQLVLLKPGYEVWVEDIGDLRAGETRRITEVYMTKLW